MIKTNAAKLADERQEGERQGQETCQHQGKTAHPEGSRRGALKDVGSTHQLHREPSSASLCSLMVGQRGYFLTPHSDFGTLSPCPSLPEDTHKCSYSMAMTQQRCRCSHRGWTYRLLRESYQECPRPLSFADWSIHQPPGET